MLEHHKLNTLVGKALPGIRAEFNTSISELLPYLGTPTAKRNSRGVSRLPSAKRRSVVSTNDDDDDDNNNNNNNNNNNDDDDNDDDNDDANETVSAVGADAAVGRSAVALAAATAIDSIAPVMRRCANVRRRTQSFILPLARTLAAAEGGSQIGRRSCESQRSVHWCCYRCVEGAD